MAHPIVRPGLLGPRHFYRQTFEGVRGKARGKGDQKNWKGGIVEWFCLGEFCVSFFFGGGLFLMMFMFFFHRWLLCFWFFIFGDLSKNGAPVILRNNSTWQFFTFWPSNLVFFLHVLTCYSGIFGYFKQSTLGIQVSPKFVEDLVSWFDHDLCPPSPDWLCCDWGEPAEAVFRGLSKVRDPPGGKMGKWLKWLNGS